LNGINEATLTSSLKVGFHLKAMVLDDPISNRFFSRGICTDLPLGRHKQLATVPAGQKQSAILKKGSD